VEIEWLVGAERDLDQCYAERFDHSEREAAALLESVEHALGLLARFPRLVPMFRRPFRRFILRRYQLAMFYTVDGNRLFIHALIDLRQSPEAILRRLGIT
jgi:plasmid stabilization system protein ParE